MSLARVTFELTSRCNLACRHCLRNRSLENDLAPGLLQPPGDAQDAVALGGQARQALAASFKRIADATVEFLGNGVLLGR